MERVVDTGRAYREGEPVRVLVRSRPGRWAIDDGGAGVRLAGKPAGWRDEAERVVAEDALNLSRQGVVFVTTVYPELVDGLVARVGDRSLAVYEALLDLADARPVRTA